MMAACRAKALASLKQRTACPCPSVGPASTMIPIRDPQFEIRNLCQLSTRPLDYLMPRFENRGDFVFENVTDGNPHSVLLGRNQLEQGMLERLRRFLPRNVGVRYVRPSKVFSQDG